MGKNKLLVIILDAVVLIAALIAAPVAKWMLWALPDCLATRVGLLCPACGGTRCVLRLFSGRLGEAFVLNPFYFVLVWYLAVALLLLNIGVFFKLPRAEAVARHMTGWRAVIIAAVLFVIFGVLRNLI